MRNDQSDATRRPNRTDQKKAAHSHLMVWPETKGDWMPAYGGGMGSASTGEDDNDQD